MNTLKNKSIYDLLIIGAGPVGLAAAHKCAQRGLKIMVLEQYNFLNQFSSSAGDTRQFRLQYSEDYMTRLSLESIKYWDEIQEHSKDILRTKVGSLWLGVDESSSSEGQIKEAIETMDRLKVPFEKLTKKEIEAVFGFNNLPDNYDGFFQKDGGTINVPATVNTLKKLCSESSLVTFLFDEKVTSVALTDTVKVKTEKGEYHSEKLLLTTGPYINELINGFNLELEYEVWQMVSAYFKLKDGSRDLPSWFIYENESDSDPGFYYGFENCSWSNPGFLRIAPAFATDRFKKPGERKPKANINDLKLTVDWVKKRIPFVDCTPQYISTCLASIPTKTSKKMFLDFITTTVNQNKNILAFSSGWAFKFVPLLGKICADLLIDGQTQYDISHFNFNDKFKDERFQINKRRLPF
ncbi:sarcosine oxidase [Cnuella takakiae]|uniref:Sarcosine oxidase n=1 Tax=Cnuella takakiae TaxID=1302690 RepID=A0A1M5CH81_9BACT|nr:FAD-dependent oxidoreductase [Cnuella takakiae]SHF54089.1 sarcosine oxidase [Cnuella takakiae]